MKKLVLTLLLSSTSFGMGILNPTPKKHHLEVKNGTGSGDYFKGEPVFLNKRALISRDEWIARKKQVEEEYKARMGLIEHVFKILDGEKIETTKKKKKVKRLEN